MRYYLYIILFILAACKSNSKQENKPVADPPFWNDIQNFKRQDSISSPQKGVILLIGSSSFTMWEDVQNDFPGYTIVNRGFGGSTLLDQIRYADDIIFPYQPKQIVIYCGENDLASSDSVTATMVVGRFKQLYAMIREKTEAPVAYVSMKPSPSRRHLFQKMREANGLIKNFLASQKNAVFIDIHQKMLNAAGEPIPEIFLEDSLHMNAKGYAIWQETMKPYLIK
ncbi:MAG TPA: GDSL-type esterase/lipase family protein [Chitinophagaceae bacterium]|nr:GDSL-type esterase/lipase family protein [Chitinophagaceae bacterium]